jgi:hypothetical protein
VGTLANAAYQDNLGAAFANSLYFLRAGASHKGSKFAVNSIDIDPYQLTPLEVYNKVLLYIGFQNIDMGTAGLHPGCMSVYHWQKYYFADICDLTNISGKPNFMSVALTVVDLVSTSSIVPHLRLATQTTSFLWLIAAPRVCLKLMLVDRSS